ncbi:MAG: beta-lactamase family protein [Clostridiales bacterium]|nr:beta-lactamase family protein [Clostridiales bacterium]
MQDRLFETVSPESLGIPSVSVIRFLDKMKTYGFPIHSYIVTRHGKIAAEGYTAPFGPDTKHRMYSVSKSFTSVAIGMLITEGRLSLDDTAASFFPEYLPEDPSPYTLRATVRDLLRMATPNEEGSYNWDSPDFVRTFFDNKIIKHEPGTIFHYDTAGTTVLMAIVEKLAGKKILEYMRPLFDALGISKDIWCVETPEGRSWTGSGILCTPRDLLTFGQFCMNRGEWNGKQWVDRQYMTEATTKQIDITTADSSYIRDGYGYQFWMMRRGGFACCGMGCQYAFMDPETDTVMVITADTQGINNAEDAIKYAYYDLLDAMADGPLPENGEELKRLRQYVTKMPMHPGSTDSPLAAKVSGVTYDFEDNLFGFKWMRADFEGDKLRLSFEKPNGCFTVDFGMGKWLDFIFPEKYAGRNIARMDTNYRCITHAVWDSEDTVVGKVMSVDDYLGSFRIQLTFKGDTLTVFMTKHAENFFNDYRGYLAGHAR